MARHFAREGFAVALLSRSEEKLLPVEEAIKKEGGHAVSIPCDAGEWAPNVSTNSRDPPFLPPEATHLTIIGCSLKVLSIRVSMPSLPAPGYELCSYIPLEKKGRL